MFVFISFELEMDPLEMATAESGLMRGIGLNSFLTLKCKGRRMNPTVIKVHQTFTPQGYFQLLSEIVQWEQMEMCFVSKVRFMTS